VSFNRHPRNGSRRRRGKWRAELARAAGIFVFAAPSASHTDVRSRSHSKLQGQNRPGHRGEPCIGRAIALALRPRPR